MIVVDTSALIAILLREAAAVACQERLKKESVTLLSAVTLGEALIVAGRRGRSADMDALLAGLDCEVVPIGVDGARAAAAAYARWGRGVHPARLNLGDCFAYALARERGAPLLYVGDDFAQTDVASALPGAAPS